MSPFEGIGQQLVTLFWCVVGFIALLTPGAILLLLFARRNKDE